MNTVFIVDDVDSATGRCIKNIAAILSGSHIISSYKSKSCETPNSFLYASKKNQNIKFDILMNLYRWPVKNPNLSNQLFNKFLDLISNHHVDVVVCAYNSIESLICGTMIKKRFPNIKVVAYFLDAFYKGAKLSFLPQCFCDIKTLKWQDKLFRHCDGIVMMKSVEKFYINKKFYYSNKIKFLDLPLVGSFNSTNANIGLFKFDHNYVNFVYVGSLPKNIRNPEFVCKLFESLEDKLYRLYIFGNNDYKKIESSYKNRNVFFMGNVDYRTALEAMNAADVLVNIGNTIPSMTPSKIFEYMNFNKKIISFTSVSNDSSERYIKTYGNGISIGSKSLSDNIRKSIIKFVSKPYVTDNSAFLHEKFFLNTPKAFIEYIEDLYEN